MYQWKMILLLQVACGDIHILLTDSRSFYESKENVFAVFSDSSFGYKFVRCMA